MQDDNNGKTGNCNAGDPSPKRETEGLANTLAVERNYQPDREAMLAALRVLLGLPKVPPGRIEGLRR